MNMTLFHRKNTVSLWAVIFSLSLTVILPLQTSASWEVVSGSLQWQNLSGVLQTSLSPKVTRPKIVAKPRPLLLQTFLHDVCTRVWQWLPIVYKQVKVDWPNVKNGTTLYNALQKCVYLGVLEQTTKVNNLQLPVRWDFIVDFLQDKFQLTLPSNLNIIDAETVSQNVWNEDIRYRIPTYYGVQRLLELSAWATNASYESPLIQSEYFNAFASVYNALKNDYHYVSGSIDEEKVLYWAIKGMMESLHDPYSVYFPPEEATDFFNNMQGEIYGIGVYVDNVDWYFTIVSTLKNAPAEQAGLQAWDRVTAIDDWQVPESFTISQITSRIKWPAWTKVVLTINRWWSVQKYTVTRQKITVPLLETSYMNNNMVFAMHSFGIGLDTEFANAIEQNRDNIKNAKNIIIDLRSNWGGYVDVAKNIMEQFVGLWKILVQNERAWGKWDVVVSQAQNDSVFVGKNIYLLINRGTASASEQLAWVIKEYYPTAKLVWTQSFGKWSMQTIIGLPNAWSVKYTVALWYYGASKTSVEKKWLIPDILLEDNTKTPEDEILNKVLNY